MSSLTIDQDDFTNRAKEWTSQPANAFLPTISTSYAVYSPGVSGPSRFVNVSVSGSYTFNMVGGQNGVAIYLNAGEIVPLRAVEWTAGPMSGVVVFLW